MVKKLLSGTTELSLPKAKPAPPFPSSQASVAEEGFSEPETRETPRPACKTAKSQAVFRIPGPLSTPSSVEGVLNYQVLSEAGIDRNTGVARKYKGPLSRFFTTPLLWAKRQHLTLPSFILPEITSGQQKPRW